ncbi:MAG: hypothetical protein JXA20_03975 [Spirochaetes bacterium]|nr:hypothetical protein [Spirochaetota bacterium]
MKETYDVDFTIAQRRIRFTVNLNHFYYFPFIGWLYPMALKKGDEAAMVHARQGFVMALFFTVLLTLLSFSTIFIHTGFRVMRLVIVIFIYLMELLYFSLCIWATMNLVKGKAVDIPLVKEYAEKVNV